MMATPNPPISHEQIAALAYQRFAARGYQNGHDLDDWLWAESALRAAAATGGEPGKRPAPHHHHAAPEHHHHHQGAPERSSIARPSTNAASAPKKTRR
jgi:hypothetical protein